MQVNGIIFFLARFGTGPWADAPFYAPRSQLTVLDRNIPEGMGLSLHAMLVDASTGVLIAQKMIGLPHELTVRLVDAIAEQPEIADYDALLSETMAAYTTHDLLAIAQEN